MSRQIVFYAPTGTGVPQHLLGGGEKGCRRTREILINAEYEVFSIDKPHMGKGSLNYIKIAIRSYFGVLRRLLSDKNVILYVVGFYEKNIYMEYLITITGKLIGHKVIYEARNGRLIKAYYEYGRVYKNLMNYILKNADIVFAQGLEYTEFIKEKYDKHAVYTPNYVMNRSLKPYVGDRPLDVIRLIYFGRISETKNVDVVLKVASGLENKGYKTSIVIVGGYTKEYKAKLDFLIAELKLSDSSVLFMGHQSFEVISNELQKAHFFVFPSEEKMEGHSNSLTEAMTFGVVPIVSTAGFNASVVGKTELVVDDINPERYVDVILEVIQTNNWSSLSQYVYQRIKDNYTEDRVREAILGAISRL